MKIFWEEAIICLQLMNSRKLCIYEQICLLQIILLRLIKRYLSIFRVFQVTVYKDRPLFPDPFKKNDRAFSIQNNEGLH